VRRVLAGLAIAGTMVAAGVSASDSAGARTAIDGARFLAHVRYLASDDLEGRGNGSAGLERAAEYIAAEFARAGLTPAGSDGSFFQPFDVTTGLKIEPGNALRLDGPRGASTLDLGADYCPASSDFSGAEPLSNLPLVFAGYGIQAPGLLYDDYAGVTAKGAAVLVFAHEPQELAAGSPFAGTQLTAYASLASKALTARARGARVLLVVDDFAHRADGIDCAPFMRDPQTDELGLPVLLLRRQSVRAALGDALDLTAAWSDIDLRLKPRSTRLGKYRVTVTERYSRISRRVRNVVGVLTGARRPDEAVVIGAHYDHLGLGVRSSLAPAATGEIHNGADDNASGTAALIEMARSAIGRGVRPARSLIFVAFAGEELGLLGSAHYAEHPAVPLSGTAAMINLDMIGRPRGRIFVSGLDSAAGLEADVQAAFAGASIALDRSKDGAGFGSSDDTNFLLRQVPAVHFFSGFHGDYHRPTDDWDRLDADGAAEVARIALALATRVANRVDRLAFVARADSVSH
jgi:hypothetical protein